MNHLTLSLYLFLSSDIWLSTFAKKKHTLDVLAKLLWDALQHYSCSRSLGSDCFNRSVANLLNQTKLNRTNCDRLS